MTRFRVFLLMAAVFSSIPGGTLRAQTYQLEASVVSGGGMAGSNSSYRHLGTLGQPHPVGGGSSTGIILWSGFWRAQRSLLVSPVHAFAPLTDRLWQNSPNPFNPVTKIRFSIADPAHVQLAVFNVRGARVRTLFNESRPAGQYDAVWDGRDDSGAQAPSGVYVYRLINGDHQQTAKMLLVK